jgi:very-short-patch-repair endonuclease
MRLAPTPAEAKAWEVLQRLGFERQVSITTPRHRSAGATNGWILDLFHRKKKLCVELDGGVHARTKGRDGRRDRALRAIGIATLRFPNSFVLKQPQLFQLRVVETLNGMGEEEEKAPA